MKILNLFSTILLSATAFCSCQKHDETPVQPDKITIDITSLSNGESFRKGDTIKVQGTISYITQMHGFELTMKSKTTGKELFYYYEHVHSDNVSFSQQWADTLSQADSIQLLLTAEIDHDGNQSTKQLTFTSQP